MSILSDQNALEKRIALIEDRFAVTDALSHYSMGISEGRPKDAVALFTEDGAFELRVKEATGYSVRFRLEGKPALMNGIANQVNSGANPCPMLHNVLVEIDGDRAFASALMETAMAGQTTRVVGVYNDTLVREGGRWLFRERVFTILANPPQA